MPTITFDHDQAKVDTNNHMAGRVVHNRLTFGSHISLKVPERTSVTPQRFLPSSEGIRATAAACSME